FSYSSPGPPRDLHSFPTRRSSDLSAWMPMLTFFVYIAVNWWATWYPVAEPGGGGYVAQRMLSAKDERHSLLATLWFNIAHYAVRDRKSTRLNSSHLVISYAVFCLK